MISSILADLRFGAYLQSNVRLPGFGVTGVVQWTSTVKH